ncbi:MAG: hypothetical protein Fur0035_16000 [Anaerolineales bacterium]
MTRPFLAFPRIWRNAAKSGRIFFFLEITLGLWLAACAAPPPSAVPAPQAQPSPLIAAPVVDTALPPLACPNPDCLLPLPGDTTPAPLRFALPTPGAAPVSAWRPPLYPVPWALGAYDHFYFIRPIAADEVNWPVADYRYGGVFFEGVTHTGVDIPAKAGTTVHAAAAGTVVWAGWGLFSGEPNNTSDPYGQAVAIRHDFGYNDQPLYTVYAHMRQVDVTYGQWVDVNAPLGEVGDTGYTTGPHLHFEVRVGKNAYYYTRNPELWIAPPQGWGVLAGRILNDKGETITKTSVLVRSKITTQEWKVYTYGPEAVRPDDFYGENMVLSDLPAGPYSVFVTAGEQIRKIEVEIHPGQITYFIFRGDQGFSFGLPTPIWTPRP